jgi:probable 2-oxoglutarate dehydrogenase E1 component DHKTD1
LKLPDAILSRHNELDIPNIINPLMYEKITARESVPRLFEQKLIVRCNFLPDEPLSHRFHAQQSEGIVSPKDISDSRSSYKSHLEAELHRASPYIPADTSLKEQWNSIAWSTDQSANHDPNTGVDNIF